MAAHKKAASCEEWKECQGSSEIINISSDEDESDCVITKILVSPCRRKRKAMNKTGLASLVSKRDRDKMSDKRRACGNTISEHIHPTGTGLEQLVEKRVVRRAPRISLARARNLGDLIDLTEYDSIYKIPQYEAQASACYHQDQPEMTEHNSRHSLLEGNKIYPSIETRARSSSTATLTAESPRASCELLDLIDDSERETPPSLIAHHEAAELRKAANDDARTSNDPAFSITPRCETDADSRPLSRCHSFLNEDIVPQWKKNSCSTSEEAEQSRLRKADQRCLGGQEDPEELVHKRWPHGSFPKIRHDALTAAEADKNASSASERDLLNSRSHTENSVNQKRHRVRRGVHQSFRLRSSIKGCELLLSHGHSGRSRRRRQISLDRKRRWSSLIDLTLFEGMAGPLFRTRKCSIAELTG